jgi:hypothetical protein
MKRFLALILPFLVIISCRKSETTISPVVPTVTMDSNIVYFNSTLRISKVISSSSDTSLNWISNYYYYDSTIRVQTKYPDSSKKNSFFTLGKNGFAKASIDSFWNQSGTVSYVRNYQYDYDSSNYLKTTETNGSYAYFFAVDGDLYHYGGTYWNTYYDTLNKVDIFWLPYYNGIVGKINTHLTKSIMGYFGLGEGIYREFHYTLSPNGYVKEKYETRTSGNQNFGQQEISYFLTRYSYIFNYTR